MLLKNLEAMSLGNMLASKGIVREWYGNKQKQGILSWFCIFQNKNFLVLPYPLTNFEIRKFYQNEFRFNGVYSRDDLPNKIMDRKCVINLNKYPGIRTHWIISFWQI